MQEPYWKQKEQRSKVWVKRCNQVLVVRNWIVKNQPFWVTVRQHEITILEKEIEVQTISLQGYVQIEVCWGQQIEG